MKKFRICRPRDINIEAAISDKRETLIYYAFDEPALNGFSKELSEKRNRQENSKILFSTKMATQRLESILDQYLQAKPVIDFLTIDVEGLDIHVLKSNNWEKYRPKVVLAELLGKSLEDLNNDEIAKFMRSKGYILYAKTMNTVFFL